LEHDPPVVMISFVDPGPMGFDELQPGQVFEAGPRVIDRSDIDAFTRLSGDRTALHCDDDYARTTPFGAVVAHGVLVLAVGTGLAYDTGIFLGTVLAVRSMELSFERPVFPGDSLSLRLEVTAKDSQPRIDRGRVAFGVRLTNQHGKAAALGTWTLIMRRSGEPTPPPV
jgi:acyl dehydratase